MKQIKINTKIIPSFLIYNTHFHQYLNVKCIKDRVLERTSGPKKQDCVFSVKNEETDSFQSSQPFCSKKLESLPEYQNKIFIFQHRYKILINNISNSQYDSQMCGIVFWFLFLLFLLGCKCNVWISIEYLLCFVVQRWS